MTARDLQTEIRKLANPARAKSSMSFFKTGPGQYGEGDQFIGLTVPHQRMIARKYRDLSFDDLKHLLASPIHEERLMALIILVERYEKADKPQQKKIFHFYLKNRAGVNNWDLVDTSAHKIVGEYCLHNSHNCMQQMIASKKHWDRRIAMIATLAFIRAGKTKIAFVLAAKLLDDQEDLMHKASGWMLREAGKRNEKALRLFIKRYGKKMPRTMLRYSIEKFSASERKKFLKVHSIIW